MVVYVHQPDFVKHVCANKAATASSEQMGDHNYSLCVCSAVMGNQNYSLCVCSTVMDDHN